MNVIKIQSGKREYTFSEHANGCLASYQAINPKTGKAWQKLVRVDGPIEMVNKYGVVLCYWPTMEAAKGACGIS